MSRLFYICSPFTYLESGNPKEDIASDGQLFQSSDKKVTCLTPTRIKLDIFVKFLRQKHFLHFSNNNFDFILFIKRDTFESNSVSFFLSCSLQPTKSCFVSLKAISDRDLQTMHHPSMNYWFQYCDLH